VNRVVIAAVVAVGLIAGVLTYMGNRPARVQESVAPAASPAPPRDRVRPTPAPADATTPSRPASERRDTPARPMPAPEPVAPAAPTMATLHITSDVPGAQVFIDRKFIGTAPVTAEDVAPGTRQVNVSAPGYEGVAETLEVTPGPRDVLISLKTIRLDQSVSVTHKHRIGSCTGRLIATPEGLRYETDNKDDGFVVALTVLQTFSVDLAAKV